MCVLIANCIIIFMLAVKYFDLLLLSLYFMKKVSHLVAAQFKMRTRFVF